MRRFTKYHNICLTALFAVGLSSCMFTGVESTSKITDKDVKKAMPKVITEEEQEANNLKITHDSLPSWKVGKRFFVTDDNVRLLFSPSELFDTDTLHLKGKTLRFKGTSTGSVLDNRAAISILLTDGVNNYVYPTNKTIDEFNSNFNIPFLIDMDLVESLNSQLAGKQCYIKTLSWFDHNGNAINGRKFVKVTIDSVLPGNKVYPTKVKFTAADTHQSADVWMTVGNTPIRNRSFDSLFSMTDIRKKYPDITEENWNLIVNGRVAQSMTKHECRLALGTPTSIDYNPSYEGVGEVWVYPGGVYLFFIDGLLSKFRQ